MISFNSLNELYNEISKDRVTHSIIANRFPIRFIFLKNRADYLNLKNQIAGNGCTVFNLKDKVPFGDGWFTKDDIVNFFCTIKSNGLVVGLSEVLRFFDDITFKATLEQICSIESRNMRIYVLMFGLIDRFNFVFWNGFYRKNEWAPIWILSGENETINIYQVNSNLEDVNLNLDEYEIVKNTSDWLNILESRKEKILSFSHTLSNFFVNFLPDANYTYYVLNNIKDFLMDVLGKNIAIQYKQEEKNFWKSILTYVLNNNAVNSFDSLIANIFNIRDIEQCDVFDFLKIFFEENDDFKRWLIKKYITEKETFSKYKYLIQIFKDNLSDKELKKELWLKAFDIDEDGVWNERKEILEYVHNRLNEDYAFIENDLIKKLENHFPQDFDNFKKKLTLITKSEKCFYVKKIKDLPEVRLLNELREGFPELFYYLNWDNINLDYREDWVKEYFKNYNLSKLKDELKEEIVNLINEKNSNKQTFCDWYYKFERPEIINVDFIWVDGLGVEWFPLLVHYLEYFGKEHKVVVENKKICRALLPTITEINKWDNYEKVSDLDEYIHRSSSYKFPDSLIDEIEIIKSIAKKIVEKVKNELVISSDHGLTFLANKKFDKNKIYDFENANHEGRCVLNFDKELNEDNYFTWDLDYQKGIKALVASKHYSLSNVPRRETHGGAAPEEVLIPYIKLRKVEEEIKYLIKPAKLEVDIRNPIIKIRIEPEPNTDVYLNILDKEFLLKKENDYYSMILKDIKTGEYECFLHIGLKKFNRKVIVKGGFKEDKLL